MLLCRMKPEVSLGVPQALDHTVNIVGLNDCCRSLLTELFYSICYCHKCSSSHQAKVVPMFVKDSARFRQGLSSLVGLGL